MIPMQRNLMELLRLPQLLSIRFLYIQKMELGLQLVVGNNLPIINLYLLSDAPL